MKVFGSSPDTAGHVYYYLAFVFFFKIDVTSSDKENKNIWSTSSSDSSVQSNLPSDAPHSPSEHIIQPPPQLDHLGRLSDLAEGHGQPPRQSSPIGVVVTQMASGMSDGGQILQSDPGQRAEVRQPAGVGQGKFMQDKK